MFRCRACGKWSHAQRKPKTHQRWVYQGDPEYRDELNENVGYDGDYGGAPSAHPVACGPFDTYIAAPEGEETAQ